MAQKRYLCLLFGLRKYYNFRSLWELVKHQYRSITILCVLVMHVYDKFLVWRVSNYNIEAMFLNINKVVSKKKTQRWNKIWVILYFRVYFQREKFILNNYDRKSVSPRIRVLINVLIMLLLPKVSLNPNCVERSSQENANWFSWPPLPPINCFPPKQ